MARQYQIVAGLKGYREGYVRMSDGPDYRQIKELETVFAENFAASQAAVHVITGKLKLSGSPHTRFDGSTWEGEITYDADPGIFELARHDNPTYNHPEGQHAELLDVSEKFYPQYDAAAGRMLPTFWDQTNG